MKPIKLIRYHKFLTRLLTRRRFLRSFVRSALGGGGFSTAFFLKQKAQSQTSGLDNLTLNTADFTVLTVNDRGVEISRRREHAQFIRLDLGNDITLDMVAIPGGKFLRGSSSFENGHNSTERPQQEVTVQSFFMGKYLITQAQWREIALMPKIEIDLEPDPSLFKGDELPVDSVSWYDALEFCLRLSRLQAQNSQFRLPSEAEGEYACRAGTNTPFYFGETTTAKLANYYARNIYANELAGIYRDTTTQVGSFPPNSFGLYDMHGNLWEWCQDHWHKNYKRAPNNGSPWLSDKENASRVLRGGSWQNDPWFCRSASRSRDKPEDKISDVGFRVVCFSARRRNDKF